MSALDTCIVKACENAWDKEFIAGVKNRDNCSGLVKAVAIELGAPIDRTAVADGIVDGLAKSWSAVATGKDAAQKAAAGKLVVAGLKSTDHTPARNNGHVVIVVSGKLYREKYPLCWGGSLGSAQSRGNKSVGEVWNRTDRDNVAYYAYDKAVCKA